MRHRDVLLGLLLAGWTGLASAGDFYERNGLALGGYDPVAYIDQHQAVPGTSEYAAIYRGSRFQFASAAHRDRFSAAPERFAPEYGGYCAFGVANGYKATSDPEAFTIVNDKLYLNYSREVQARWREDPAGYIAQADRKWPAVQHSTTIRR